MKKLASLFLGILLVTGLRGQAVQKVIIEEHTGAWCGYCPDGDVILEDVLSTYPNAVAISHHNGDAMVTTEGNYLSSFYVQGYPQATFNRKGLAISRSSWAQAAADELAETPTVSVGFESYHWDWATRTLTVTVRVEFLTAQTGAFRINCALAEDVVVGLGTGYNQTNYYNTTPGHPYYGAGNPILLYEHKHVSRTLLGGAWGTANVIPSSVAAGDVFTHTYTRVFPSAWDEYQMELVAFVSHFDGSGSGDRAILNGEEMAMSQVLGGLPSPQASQSIQVFPNPSSTLTHIAFELPAGEQIQCSITNLFGQKVATVANGYMTAGFHTLNWNLTDDQGHPVPSGMYGVTLLTESGRKSTQRVMVAQ